MKLKVGSRESKLAVIQTEIVMEALAKANPGIDLELVTMKTTGDKILDRTLDKVGGKGLFVKELDQALREGRVDLTVHSLKDLPMEISEDLPIVAVSKREDPRDALILPKGKTEIDFTKPIGSASSRRKILLEELYPNCFVEPIRGNVLTRLEKLDRGEFSATTLALAGLKRLNMTDRVSFIYEPEQMLPAACQGVIAVQARADFNLELLGDFNDPETFAISLAERSFVATLEGGCSAPVAAYGQIIAGKLTLTGLYIDSLGKPHKDTIVGEVSQGVVLGKTLALDLKHKFN